MSKKKVVVVLAILMFCLLSQTSFTPVSSIQDRSALSVATTASSWTVSISASPKSGDAPLTVDFQAVVSPLTGAGDFSISWNFGDKGTGIGVSTSHVYSETGNYSAFCQLLDERNHVVARSNQVTIKVNQAALPALTASIVADPSSGTAPLDVHFYSQVSGGQAPYTYSWNFGDGQTYTGNNPSHHYANPGTYTATLTVSDRPSHGGRTLASATITVEKKAAPPLQVSFSANQTAGYAPLSVSFTPSVSGGTPPYVYSWDFGTGDTSSQAEPSYLFPSPGIKYVTLTVQDSDSPRSQTKYVVAIVVSEAPTPPPEPADGFTAIISGSSDKGGTPLTVQFNSMIKGGDPNYVYQWSFGDGETSTDVNPSHTFTQPGQYYVHLNVSDSGLSTITSNTLIINVESPSATAGVMGDTGNPMGALLALAAFGVAVLTTILLQVFKKKKTVKGKGA